MTKNLDTDGLSSIAHNYDLFYIDLWGVVHNGINLYEGAISNLKGFLNLRIIKAKAVILASYEYLSSL